MKKLIIITALLATPLCLAQPGGGEKKGKHSPPQFVIDKFDADGDGKLNETEREAAHAHREAKREEIKALRDSYDFDSSGDLDENEKAAFKEAMEQKIIEHFDTDGDGQLDEQEQANADAARAHRESRKENCKKGDKGKGKGPRGGAGGQKTNGGGSGGLF